MTTGAYQMQLMPAAGAARVATPERRSASWSHSFGIGTGTGVLAAKPCSHVVTIFGDLTNHRQPEEAPL